MCLMYSMLLLPYNICTHMYVYVYIYNIYAHVCVYMYIYLGVTDWFWLILIGLQIGSNHILLHKNILSMLIQLFESPFDVLDDLVRVRTLRSRTLFTYTVKPYYRLHSCVLTSRVSVKSPKRYSYIPTWNFGCKSLLAVITQNVLDVLDSFKNVN